MASILLAVILVGIRIGAEQPHRPDAALSAGHECPCSVFTRDPPSTPSFASERKPVEVGLLFRANISGFAAAVRFYKAPGSTGLHVGHFWSRKGEMLAAATFREESGGGWQYAHFDPPVELQADANYVISYFSPNGSYSFSEDFFRSELRRPELTAPVDAGRFLYSPHPGVPASSYRATNYWVDVVFTRTAPTEVPLALTPQFPAPGASGIAQRPRISALFTRRMRPETVTAATVRLFGPQNKPIPSDVEYLPGTRNVLLRPRQALAFDTAYTVQVLEGIPGPRDVSGNMLDKPVRWGFRTGSQPRVAADADAPILILTSASHPFSTYTSEILRAEGLNEFRVVEIERLSPELLRTAMVAVLGDFPVTESQMHILSTWVTAGGKLIAMRPDRRYDPLYGIKHQSSTISDAYLKIDTSRLPGAGLTGETMQFHGAADVYLLAGATGIATLFSGAAHSTEYAAVSWFREGKGMSAAFAFDLARSVVLTRQGNPAWSGMERDGISPIRSDDLFYGPSGAGAAAGWLDFAKIQIPQADELQRLFANLLLQFTGQDQPLPRFWYLPRGLKAAVVMTGDDHGKGNTVNRFENALAASAPNCSLEDWECVRASAYLFPASLTREQADKYAADGFDIGVHVSTDCADWPLHSSPSEMNTVYERQLAAFAGSYPNLPQPATSRTHCIAWGDYDTQPRVESALGIRLDTNYYYWPQQWVQDRPGLFTGSGMPMRFATRNGNPIDVYQAATFLTDESGQSYPLHIDALLDNALGTRGYYGTFTANMHADLPESPQAEAILGSALAHNVPVISAQQLLDWVDARNGSWFDKAVWNEGNLAFSVSAAAGAYGLQAMLPSQSSMGLLTALFRDGQPAPFTTGKIKGIDYCIFAAASGRFVAEYRPAIKAPQQISNVSPASSPGERSEKVPSGWTFEKWSPSGAAHFVTAGVTLNGARIAQTARVGPGAHLAFDAVLSPKPYQHVGFASDLNASEPWILFSTGTAADRLYARVSGMPDVPIPGSWFGSQHHFEIDWLAETVEFRIDHKAVATQRCAIDRPLRAVASDLNVGKEDLKVAAMEVKP